MRSAGANHGRMPRTCRRFLIWPEKPKGRFPSIKRAKSLCESLFNSWKEALLFRDLATLRKDVPVFDSIEELRWKGPTSQFEKWGERLRAKGLMERMRKASEK